MNWDDVRVFLEVARTEKLTDAAKQLNMDSSTVSRRLHKLEESLSAKLFDRTLEGHKLTTDGVHLLNSARKMEQDAKLAVEGIQQSALGQSGIVRIGVTEAFGNFFVAPNLLSFREQFPHIQIDLLNFSRFVKISRNEADIAIAVERPKSTSVIITKLCDYKLKVYGNRQRYEQFATARSKTELEGMPWVSYVENLIFTDQLSYEKELAITTQTVFRSTSVISQYAAIKSGLGVGVLPCFLADKDDDLVALCQADVEILRSFWLVTHPESKRLARVANVWEYLKTLCHSNYSLLMSER
ncbi:LysR family transcriptional regulator [Thalassotalea fusca]